MPSKTEARFQRKADVFHDAERKDWPQFEKDLKSVLFQKALQKHGLSDEKLKKYVEHYGGFLRAKESVGQVPSTSSAKQHTLKKLQNGRLGCSCKDWQYKHSHQGTDCKHIKSFRSKTKVSMLNPEILKGFRIELEKLSARRGLKEIRKMVAGGHAEKAHALAQKSGVLKPTPYGHQVKDIGRGGEGLATLVAGPEHGLAVRKLFDPKGASSETMIKRKEMVGKKVNSPFLPKFHGATETPGMPGTMHTSEYVRGTPVAPNDPGLRSAMAGTQKAIRKAGFEGARDVRAENMIKTPSGQIKTIDHMPARHREFVNPGQLRRAGVPDNVVLRHNDQYARPSTSTLRTIAPQLSQGGGEASVPMLSAGQLKAQMFRGATPRPAPRIATPAPMGNAPAPAPTSMTKTLPTPMASTGQSATAPMKMPKPVSAPTKVARL